MAESRAIEMMAERDVVRLDVRVLRGLELKHDKSLNVSRYVPSVNVGVSRSADRGMDRQRRAGKTTHVSSIHPAGPRTDP